MDKSVGGCYSDEGLGDGSLRRMKVQGEGREG